MFCKTIENSKGDFLIGGDFNFPDILWKEGFPYNPVTCSSSTISPFVDCIHDLSAFQAINQPTHCCPHQQPILLDLVFVNNNELIQRINYLPPIGKSDHLAIELVTHRHKARNRHKKRYLQTMRLLGSHLDKLTGSWPSRMGSMSSGRNSGLYSWKLGNRTQ